MLTKKSFDFKIKRCKGKKYFIKLIKNIDEMNHFYFNAIKLKGILRYFNAIKLKGILRYFKAIKLYN